MSQFDIIQSNGCFSGHQTPFLSLVNFMLPDNVIWTLLFFSPSEARACVQDFVTKYGRFDSSVWFPVSPVFSLSGTISKLQQFQDLPCAMAEDIRVQKADASRISLLQWWPCVLESVRAASCPITVKVTRTKYRVKPLVCNDFMRTMSYPDKDRCAEAGDSYKCGGMEMYGKHQK